MKRAGSNLFEMAWRKPMRKTALLVVFALGLPGCAADYVTGSNAAVNLYVVSVNGGNPLQASVRFPVQPNIVDVEVANRAKNPNLPLTQKVTLAIIVERYEVRYYRSDGKNTEGVDVPYRISGNIAVGFDAESTGTATIPVEVVRAQAKVEPPLTQLRGFSSIDTNNGVTTSGQAFVLTCFAEITIHGKTIAGQVVTATGRLQIDFADWP
jgi:hypothetical protein